MSLHRRLLQPPRSRSRSCPNLSSRQHPWRQYRLPSLQPATQESRSFFARLKQGLSKTSASLGEGMASLFLGKKVIDDDLLDDLETRLLTADVGVEATTADHRNLTKRVARKELADSGALYKALQEELVTLLKPVEQPLVIDTAKQPYVILVVGVNGVGKTTTIGKLAKKLQLEGKKVMLAAGDTFRAAAVEQLQVWGERNNIAVIAQHTGADSASVIFDAVQAAKVAWHRRADRRHRRPPAHQRQPDGRAEEGPPGDRQAGRDARRTKCCWCWMPAPGRTPSTRPSSSTRRSTSPAWR